MVYIISFTVLEKFDQSYQGPYTQFGKYIYSRAYRNKNVIISTTAFFSTIVLK